MRPTHLMLFDADPPRNDRPHRKSVIRGYGLAVEGVGQQRVVLERLGQRQRPVHLHRVEAFDEHVHDIPRRAAPDPGHLQHRAERHASPLRHPDGALPPLRARRDLAHDILEEPPPVAGALDEARDRARGQAQQLVEAELEGPLEGVALDAQPPGARVDDRRRGVVADEEVAGGREVAPERLQSGFLVDAVVDEDLARHGLDVELLRRRLGKRLATRGKADRRSGTGCQELPSGGVVRLHQRECNPIRRRARSPP